MKKIIKMVVIFGIIFVCYLAVSFFHKDYRFNVDDSLYQNFTASTKYQGTYPVEDYVDEQMDASAILRAVMIGSMANYDDFVGGSSLGEKFKLGLSILTDYNEYSKFTADCQYEEQTPISIEYVGEQYDHNFKYNGVLEDGTEVSGNLAMWGDEDSVSTAISFQDGNGNIDENKARLFADDSNSEMMAYLMIEQIQGYLGTNMDPNEAALKFFNSSLETVAGSISYHAAVSLYSVDHTIGEYSLSKVKTANISTIDEDGYLVNQSY